MSQILKIKRETIIGFFGSSSEAYNMAIYMFLAPFLAPILFSSESEIQAIIYSYTLTFVGALIAYPLGALYYGSIGDRDGRRQACSSASLGLALATGLMGLVPIDYLNDSAWIFYLLLCCSQFFFSGGEYHSSVIFSLEHGKDQDKGILSGLSCLFAVLGIIAAKTLSTFSSYGLLSWRWLFFFGFLGGLLSYAFKFYCEETPDFVKSQKKHTNSGEYGNFLKTHALPLVKSTLVMGYFSTIYSFIFIFLPLVLPGNIESTTLDTIIGLLIYGSLLVFSGWLSDKIGIDKMMRIGALGFTSAILPLMFLTFYSNLFIIATLTIFACFFIGPMHSWLLMQFAPAERCRGIMIGSATSSALFAGTTVPMSLHLYNLTNSVFVCCLYPFIFGIVVLSVMSLKSNKVLVTN